MTWEEILILVLGGIAVIWLLVALYLRSVSTRKYVWGEKCGAR